MGKDRHIPAHAAIDHGLAKGVVQMVVTANDMRDSHVMIVNDDGKHIGRRPVGAKDHHIVKRPVLYRHPALDSVINGGLATVRHAHANHKGAVRRIPAIAPGGPDRHPGGARLVTQRSQLILCQMAVIGRTASDKLCRDFCMAGGAGRLADGGLITLEPKP